MTPLRVLFIITGLATGGAEIALLRLIRHLPDDIEAQVISLTDAGTIGPQLDESGVTLTTLNMRPGRSSLIAFLRLTWLIRSLQPDIVQTWMYHADLFGGLAARLAGIRRLVWAIHHSNLDACRNKRGTLAVVKVCASLSRWLPVAIVSCSEVARRVHVTQGYRADLFKVLPNGIELDRFRPDDLARQRLRSELLLAADTPLVGFIARFDPQKNHEGFLHAAELVHCLRPDVHFILAGRGVDDGNARLCAWRDAAGLRDVVHLLGERGDVPDLMASLDALVSASWGEAFPNVLAEAMACGVPCAATDAGDSARIVGDSGHIVTLGEMQALANALLDLLNAEPETRSNRSRQARIQIVEQFGIESVAAAYATFYRSLI